MLCLSLVVVRCQPLRRALAHKIYQHVKWFFYCGLSHLCY
ncbi:C4-dicarboxylate ABC transporter [Vibrio cholerae]|nr:C4-dicarboxylate ABC transporter [Vibrio cholerae]